MDVEDYDLFDDKERENFSFKIKSISSATALSCFSSRYSNASYYLFASVVSSHKSDIFLH